MHTISGEELSTWDSVLARLEVLNEAGPSSAKPPEQRPDSLIPNGLGHVRSG
jgi:hypothetical protein